MQRILWNNISLALGVLVLLSGCAGPTQTALSDGTMANRVECDGTPRGLNYCFERAGKTCGAADYTIVDENGAAIARSDVANAETAALIKQYANDQNSILVKCD